MDETAIECDYVCPTTNYLESWLDMHPYTGFYSLQQPTISPLFNSRQAQHSLLVWMDKSESYLDYLKSFVTSNIYNNWNKILHDGYIDKGSKQTELSANSFDISIAKKIKKPSKKLELEFQILDFQ